MAFWSDFRTPFTTQQAFERGFSHSALKWAVCTGAVQRVAHGVYVDGGAKPNAVEMALAPVVAGHRHASGTLAAVIYEMDVWRLEGKLTLPANASMTTFDSFAIADPLTTLRTLARVLNDLEWEQLMESALFRKLVTVVELEACADRRIRRVLKLRPEGAPPTESLLETLCVQLIRKNPSLPEPTRQLEVFNARGEFEARVDLAFPNQGIFFELDGQQHKGQPVYDADRQTRVVAATGWLVGRFSWREIVHQPNATLRRIAALFETAAATKAS